MHLVSLGFEPAKVALNAIPCTRPFVLFVFAELITPVSDPIVAPMVVVLGCHFDSWDVGTGATDDGGACIASWEAVRLMKALGLRPRRTVRAVLFTNEENGGRGGVGYRDRHQAELVLHKGTPVSYGGHTFVFEGLRTVSSPSRTAQEALVRVE